MVWLLHVGRYEFLRCLCSLFGLRFIGRLSFGSTLRTKIIYNLFLLWCSCSLFGLRWIRCQLFGNPCIQVVVLRLYCMLRQTGRTLVIMGRSKHRSLSLHREIEPRDGYHSTDRRSRRHKQRQVFTIHYL